LTEPIYPFVLIDITWHRRRNIQEIVGAWIQKDICPAHNLHFALESNCNCFHRNRLCKRIRFDLYWSILFCHDSPGSRMVCW
jgi:hypothetical protein